MELRIFTEPQQGASYETLLKVAQAAEELEYGAFSEENHLVPNATGAVDLRRRVRDQPP